MVILWAHTGAIGCTGLTTPWCLLLMFESDGEFRNGIFLT